MNVYAYNSDDVEMVSGRRYGLAEEGVMLQFSPSKKFFPSPHS